MGEIIYHFSEASDLTYFEPPLATPELGAVAWDTSSVCHFLSRFPSKNKNL